MVCLILSTLFNVTKIHVVTAIIIFLTRQYVGDKKNQIMLEQIYFSINIINIERSL